MTSRASGRRRTWLRRLAMLSVSLLLLALAARLVGSRALLDGWTVLSPTTVGAALLAGLVATSAQALRWRILAGQRGIGLTFRRALADCYASGFGNMVLPGGLGGDAARVAVHRDSGDQRWTSPLVAVGAERLSATTVLFAVAAVTLQGQSIQWAAAAAVIALACLVIALRCMRGLGVMRSALVWGSSVLGVLALVALYLTAMRALGGPVVPVLAIVGLASMSVPLGIGGWGVRELGVGVLAPVLSVAGDHAVATATAYGLLATISCLPGMVVLVRAGDPRAADAGMLTP
ncbi:MAG: lysylphosphatidylglycerol synthase transmembrane domain-containing protein [Arachnia sp.]